MLLAFHDLLILFEVLSFFVDTDNVILTISGMCQLMVTKKGEIEYLGCHPKLSKLTRCHFYRRRPCLRRYLLPTFYLCCPNPSLFGRATLLLLVMLLLVSGDLCKTNEKVKTEKERNGDFSLSDAAAFISQVNSASDNENVQ